MVWFLRVHEISDDTFECRRGPVPLDRHDDVDAAVAHLLDLADEVGRAIVFLHRLDGRVEEIARVGLDGPVAAPPA
jgi:hypothetical protein